MSFNQHPGRKHDFPMDGYWVVIRNCRVRAENSAETISSCIELGEKLSLVVKAFHHSPDSISVARFVFSLIRQLLASVAFAPQASGLLAILIMSLGS